MNRRHFLRGTAAAGLIVGVTGSVPTQAEVPSGPVRGERGVVIPDDGWSLWIDREALWKDDSIFLPDDVDLEKLPTNAPTGGWGVLERPAGSTEFSKRVTLPTTVEQHFWGKLNETVYSQSEYIYANTDKVPRNGFYRGVSWWSKAIEIPASFRGKRILLAVRGARVRAEVYLNRKLVGYSILEELPFECDLTHAADLAPGAKNLLTIRVTNPGGRFDWADGNLTSWGKVAFYTGHGFGGLDRGLSMSAHDPVRLKDLWVLNTLERGNIKAFAEVENRRQEAESGTVVFTVKERSSGKVIISASARITTDPGAVRQVQVDIACPRAKLWDLDTPTLYEMHAAWVGDAGSRDVRAIPFGFRSFGPEGLGTNALFRLNGRRIKIYSAISWGFWGLNGLWPTPELAAKEVTQAKLLGLNCLNFHRNVGKEDVLREHDERGLLRYMEPGAGKFAVSMPNKRTQADLFSQKYMIAKCLAMVRTFRSHPSLIQWTLHNEIGGAHMKEDNGADLANPEVFEILRAMHRLDPSRSIVLNDGFIAEGKPQAWMAPWSDRVRSTLDGGAGGWWNNHQGAADSWYDIFYKNPREFTYREINRAEIVEWGEMEGVAVPDNHPMLLRDIASHGGSSYDLKDHQEISTAYNRFLDRWGFRRAFPTAESLFLSIGRKSYASWEQYLENVRICDEVDFAVVSGWESTAIENHSGIVDNFRNFKSDPKMIRGSLLPVRPVAKQRALVVQKGTPAVFDLYLLNDLGVSVGGKLTLSTEDSSGRRIELVSVPAPTYVADQCSYLLQEAFTTPPLMTEGFQKFHFAIDSIPGATHTRELLVIEANPALKRPMRVGVAGIPIALRRHLSKIAGVTLEEFNPAVRYDVLVTSGLSGESLSMDKIGDSIGEEQQVTSVAKSNVTAPPKTPGKVPDDLLEAARMGTPMLVIAQRDELADGVAKQLAAGGAFTYQGQVGDYRAPWMGNWQFIRQHPTYDGLPQDQAMSIYFQADGSLSNGLLVDGPGVEVFVAYSRDHDRQIGAATFSANYGKGKLLFQRVPDMHPLLQQRWLVNSLAWLARTQA